MLRARCYASSPSTVKELRDESVRKFLCKRESTRRQDLRAFNLMRSTRLHVNESEKR